MNVSLIRYFSGSFIIVSFCQVFIVVFLILLIPLDIRQILGTASSASLGSTMVAGIVAIPAGIRVIIGSFSCNNSRKNISYILGYTRTYQKILIVVASLCHGVSLIMAIFVYRLTTPELLSDNMKIAIGNYSKGSENFRLHMDELQKKFKCCGAESYIDWFEVDWGNLWRFEDVDVTAYNDIVFRKVVPQSCCKRTAAECNFNNITENDLHHLVGLNSRGCAKPMYNSLKLIGLWEILSHLSCLVFEMLVLMLLVYYKPRSYELIV